ncbi:methyltransferase domain-containing protein [Maridesulfovibrio sp.]|uniref:class I SAM-dependent methyltransferase n=1 Tax=Maridesulfovibrio sp. TaxID=2795000 RepID=UPI0029F47C7B|nr:methyltransferase domain-containing protein [Maridesulfovibrio sp.]
MRKTLNLISEGDFEEAQKNFDTIMKACPPKHVEKYYIQYIEAIVDKYTAAGLYAKAREICASFIPMAKKDKYDLLKMLQGKSDFLDRMENGILYENVAMPGNRVFDITMKPFSTGYLFLEHLYRPYCMQSGSTVILLKNANTLLVKDTKGFSREVEVDLDAPDEQIRTTLAITNGNHLVFTAVPKGKLGYANKNLFIFSPSWQLLHKIAMPEMFFPYGTQSVGQSFTGTICFGEYADHAPTVAIWRSDDFGLSWSNQFELPSYGRGEESQVRHFHICQPDPYIHNRWYAMTGDVDNECRLFISEDDGINWEQVKPNVILKDERLDEIKDNVLNRFLRTTSVVIKEDAIYFGTDQIFRNQHVLFCRMEKQPPFNTEISILETNQEVRSLIDLENKNFLAITQRTKPNKKADVLLINEEGYSSRFAGIDVDISGNRNHNPATSGYNSRAVLDGTAYTAVTQNRDFSPHVRALQWEIKERKNGSITCPDCDMEIQQKVLEGSFRAPYVPADNTWEVHCPNCNSRTRSRTMISFLHSLKDCPRGKTLLFAGSQREIELCSTYIASEIKNAALHERGKGSAIGYDMRYLPNVDDEEYEHVFACCVVDYIPELSMVAKEMFRILKPEGRFLFLIQPFRLQILDRAQPRVKVVSFNALSHERYNYDRDSHDGNQTNIPSCVFSMDYVVEVMIDAGFQTKVCPVWDDYSKRLDYWFEAIKR